MKNQLTFNNKQLAIIEKDNQIWITASDLAMALNYKRSDKVTQIYNRNADEFTDSMTETLKMRFSGNLNKTVRLFSLRGAHLIAMFANTDIAKMFRKWVLDILEAKGLEVTDNPIMVKIPHNGRWLINRINDEVIIKNVDNKTLVETSLFLQLQRDSAYYRNQLFNLNQQLQKFLVITNSYAERTRVTSGEGRLAEFDIPLCKLIS